MPTEPLGGTADGPDEACISEPESTVSTAADPWLEQRVRRLVLFSVTVFSVASLVATAALPYLALHQPLVLVALSPNLRNIILVASSCNPALLFGLGLFRRVLALSATYGLGAIYGPRMLEETMKRAPRLRALLRTFESLLRRFGAPVLLVLPTYTMAAVAGVARTRPWPAWIALFMGQTVWVGAAVFFGEAIAPWTAKVMAFFSRYMLPASAACVAIVLVQQAWFRKRSSTARFGS